MEQKQSSVPTLSPAPHTQPSLCPHTRSGLLHWHLPTSELPSRLWHHLSIFPHKMSDANQNQDPHVLAHWGGCSLGRKVSESGHSPHLPHSTGQGQAGGDKKKSLIQLLEHLGSLSALGGGLGRCLDPSGSQLSHL